MMAWFKKEFAAREGIIVKAFDLEKKTVLIVEDEVLLRKRIAAFLEDLGAIVIPVGTLAAALNQIETVDLDFVLLDVNLPDGNGLNLLRENRFSRNVGVIVVTADSGVKNVVEAMRLGASDYLAKPFDLDELPIVFKRCGEGLRQKRANEYEREKKTLGESGFFFGAGLVELKSNLEKIIQNDFRLKNRLPPVMITGETGVGKSSIARWLHYQGPRSTHPIIEVNCSTLSATLAESELFGHERGAFTDAKEGKIGLFEAAHNGTLFLDEISSLSMAIQTKILTAIEDRGIRRVGGSKTIKIDARLIAASLRSLKEMVAEGEFRSDLYHRLDLLRVHIPPLRQRANDVVEMANHLLNKLKKRYAAHSVVISTEGERRLCAYSWPGNVRELEHEIERSLILEDDGPLYFANLEHESGATDQTEIDATNWLNPLWDFQETGFDLEETINRFVQLALNKSAGNVSAAARLLNVSRDYVRYRLKGKNQSSG